MSDMKVFSDQLRVALGDTKSAIEQRTAVNNLLSDFEMEGAPGAVAGGAQFHLIPRTMDGKVVKHGIIRWDLVDTRIGQGIEGFQALGDREAVTGLQDARKLVRAGWKLERKGKS